jgi:hypothetical protein
MPSHVTPDFGVGVHANKTGLVISLVRPEDQPFGLEKSRPALALYHLRLAEGRRLGVKVSTAIMQLLHTPSGLHTASA